MSAMESFYAGRQGASFVIVKRFDCIDVEEDLVYRRKFMAFNTDEKLCMVNGKPVEKNANNFVGRGVIADFSYWDVVECDGTTVYDCNDGTTKTFDVDYAEGMKQCFAKGGETTSQVGYGEYVIIDTITGLDEYSNPDNGKIYRRGMNYDSDLGGAEYIGQVVGPQGASPKIDMTTVQDIKDVVIDPITGEVIADGDVQTYDMTDGDAQDGIIPGRYFDDNGNAVYNDKITYAWMTIRDRHGNVIGSKIGFTFPYLVPEFFAGIRSPYYTQADYDEGRISDTSLIGTPILDADFDLLVWNGIIADSDPDHGETGHAFYRKWRMTVPKGIKGDTQTQLEIIPTKIREGSTLYDAEGVAQGSLADAATFVYFANDDPYSIDCVYPYANENALVPCYKNNDTSTIYYAKVKDTYMLQYRYRQTNYEQHENGQDYEIIKLGDYNTLREVSLHDDGYLWVKYNADEDSYINELNNPIQWIDSAAIDAGGVITFTYNTLAADGTTHNTESLDPMPWITGMDIAQNGTVTIVYNNEVNKDYYTTGNWDSDTHTWTSVINFIDHVTIDDDGTIHFWYSHGNGESPDAGQKIKYLTDASVRTGLNRTTTLDFSGEGTGDQKIEMVWNTETVPGTKDVSIIGAPINYIMEAVVTTYDAAAPETPQNHLLVLYSDPDYRQWLIDNYTTEDKKTNRIWSYTSEKFTELDDDGNKKFVLRDDWFDLGYVKGEPGGLHIIGMFTLKYVEVTPVGTENPYDEKWYELIDGKYVRTVDTTVDPNKTYYYYQTYQDYLTDGVPPEEMTGNPEEYRGWAYVVASSDESDAEKLIYSYDYLTDKWVDIGSLSAAMTDPTQIVIVDETAVEAGTGRIIPATEDYEKLPKQFGLWFVKSSIKSVH